MKSQTTLPAAVMAVALGLMFTGIALVLVAVVAALATGERRPMLAAVAGLVLQVVGWYRLGAQCGGRAER